MADLDGFPSLPQYLAIAGSLLLIGACGLPWLITAEALYPGYSTLQNQISDLGGEPPVGSGYGYY